MVDQLVDARLAERQRLVLLEEAAEVDGRRVDDLLERRVAGPRRVRLVQQLDRLAEVDRAPDLEEAPRPREDAASAPVLPRSTRKHRWAFGISIIIADLF